MSGPAVYEFKDFRAFLKATYEFTKTQRAGYSLANFAKDLGFQSNNYASLIINGRRNLTNSAVFSIAEALSMTSGELGYFETLVHLGQSVAEKEKAFYAERLRQYRQAMPKSTARISSNTLLTEPYYPALLVVLDRSLVEDAVSKILALVPKGRRFAEKVIQEFLKSGLLKMEQGCYVLNHSHQIAHDPKSVQIQQKKYLASQIRLSARALEHQYERGAKFYSHTFSIEEKDFHFYHDRIRTLLSEVTTRSDATPCERVVQLNVQLFKADSSLYSER